MSIGQNSLRPTRPVTGAWWRRRLFPRDRRQEAAKPALDERFDVEGRQTVGGHGTGTAQVFMVPAVMALSTRVVFKDSLGERRQIPDPGGAAALELLCLSGQLTSAPSFEFALRERAGRLAGFHHAC